MANNTTNEDLIAAKVRDTTAAAKLKEMKLAVLKKEYVKLEDVNKRWEEQAARIKAKLLGLPARLAPQLREHIVALSKHHKYPPIGNIQISVENLLTQVMNETLNELADFFDT